MTSRAIVVKITLGMIGVFGRGIFILMAIIAGNRCTRITFRVAIQTRHFGMRSCEKETCKSMIELCRFPSDYAVARFAIVAEVSFCMIRVGRAREALLVTGVTGPIGSGVSVSMATDTIQSSMTAN